LFFLALHPECQKKAIKEVHSILTSDKDEVTQEDLVNMKYVEMCWKEALRLHPPGPALGRKLAEDIVLG
jgi:cytochrome P450 family 4